MKKYLKISLITLGILIVLVLIIPGILIIYLYYNSNKLDNPKEYYLQDAGLYIRTEKCNWNSSRLFLSKTPSFGSDFIEYDNIDDLHSCDIIYTPDSYFFLFNNGGIVSKVQSRKFNIKRPNDLTLRQQRLRDLKDLEEGTFLETPITKQDRNYYNWYMRDSSFIQQPHYLIRTSGRVGFSIYDTDGNLIYETHGSEQPWH